MSVARGQILGITGKIFRYVKQYFAEMPTHDGHSENHIRLSLCVTLSVLNCTRLGDLQCFRICSVGLFQLLSWQWQFRNNAAEIVLASLMYCPNIRPRSWGSPDCLASGPEFKSATNSYRIWRRNIPAIIKFGLCLTLRKSFHQTCCIL
jgi:hypothetical protein